MPSSSLWVLLSFVLACATHVSGQGSANIHPPGSPMYNEHVATMALAPTTFSHTAVKSGCWSDPTVWGSAGIPGNGNDVQIPQTVSVTFDHTYNTTNGETLRVLFVADGGSLIWSTAISTALVVDTLIVDLGGVLEIGTEWQPVRPDVKHEITFPDGAIDVTWDPTLQSRGFISHGTVRIHGAKKTAHLKAASSAGPLQGATTLSLVSAPSGWAVGDKIVIAGTIYDGYAWNDTARRTDPFPPQDEVVTITAISGATITFTPALIHDHDTPRADLRTSVGMLSHNVHFHSKYGSPVSQRAHIMFMHSRTADVRYAEFELLGRTDKSYLARDVGRTSPITPTSNVKGRYSFHFHRSGIPNFPEARSPSIAIGNSAYGSPGWCFVHHDSHAIFDSNVAYDCYGAGFSSETGNEVGRWTRNLAIYSKGVGWGDPKNMLSLTEFDTGNSGDCYWFQSRMVRAAENIAASCDNAYSYFHRSYGIDVPDGSSQLSFNSYAWQLPDALALRDVVASDDAPIREFLDNEAFACRTGLHVVKANPGQGHDVFSHLKRHTVWNSRQCATITYTAHYILEDFDCIGRPPNPSLYIDAEAGIVIENNAGDVTILNAKIERFPIGFDIQPPDSEFVDRNYIIVNPEFVNVGTNYRGLNLTYDTLLTGFTITPTLQVTYDHSLYYLEGGNPSLEPQIRKVNITGTKTDSLGSLRLPPVGDAGPDDYDALYEEVIKDLNTHGYFNDPATGRKYFVLPDFYTDRGNGDVYMTGTWVEINPNVPLHNQYFSYRDVVFAGNLTIPETSVPIVVNDVATTPQETDVLINLLANDRDPANDPLRVAAILQPDRGSVFDNGDGTVLYRPDLGYTGTQVFWYWATDNHAHFVKGTVTVTIQATGPRAPVGAAPTPGPLACGAIIEGASTGEESTLVSKASSGLLVSFFSLLSAFLLQFV